MVDLGICQERLLSGYFFSRCSLPFRWHREVGFLFLSPLDRRASSPPQSRGCWAFFLGGGVVFGAALGRLAVAGLVVDWARV